MKKYESDYTIHELISMGHIDEHIESFVILLNNMGFKTVASCEGHINDIGNCEYHWIDISMNNFNNFIKILMQYKNRSEILIQIRQDKWVVDVREIFRIFPYCKNLEEGRRMFDDLMNDINENIMNNNIIVPYQKTCYDLDFNLLNEILNF